MDAKPEVLNLGLNTWCFDIERSRRFAKRLEPQSFPTVLAFALFPIDLGVRDIKRKSHTSQVFCLNWNAVHIDVTAKTIATVCVKFVRYHLK